MPYLLSYTRKPIDNIIYDARLAYGMHIAVSADGVRYRALNHNSGVLFGKATENPDGSLNPKALKKPYILKDGDSFKIIALRTAGDGESDPEIDNGIKAIFEDNEGKSGESAYTPVRYTTKDFLIYSEPEVIAPDEYLKATAGVRSTCVWSSLSETALKGCDGILLEANYDKDMLWNGEYPYYLKKRIDGAYGHLCNDDCASTIAELCMNGTRHFILGHLSKENNLPQVAERTVVRALEERNLVRDRDFTLRIANRYVPTEPLMLGDMS